MQFDGRSAGLAGAQLFVYGTLRKGHRAHKLLQRYHARFLGTGYVQARLYNLGEYPGAIRSANLADRVHGEIYFLPRPATAFKTLDRFEGYNPARPEWNMFEREETAVKLAGGRELWAWIYWLRGLHRSGRRLLTMIYGMRRV